MLPLQNGSAAEWYVKPSISAQEIWDDNIRLTSQDINTVTGTIVSPQFELGMQTARTQISMDTRLDFARYSGEKGLNSDDQTVNMDFRHTTERSLQSLNIKLTRNSTLTSEIEDSGIITASRRREEVSISPSWGYQLDERSTIRVGANVIDVSYPDPGTTGLLEFSIVGLTGAYSRQITPKTSLDVSAYASTFNAPDSSNDEINYNGIDIGLSKNFSPTFAASFSVGQQQTLIRKRDQVGSVIVKQTIRTKGLLFDIKVRKLFKTITVAGQLSRSISPSSLGGLNAQDDYRLNLLWKLGDRMSANFTARYLNQERDTSTREFIALTTGLRWALARDLQFGATYRYASQTFDNSSNSPKSNRVMLTLGYNWDRFSISR